MFGMRKYDNLSQFYSKTTLKRIFNDKIKIWGTSFKDVNAALPKICRLFKEKNNIGNDTIEIVLGIDAMSVEPDEDTTGTQDRKINSLFLI